MRVAKNIELCYCLNAWPCQDLPSLRNVLDRDVPRFRGLIPGADAEAFAVGLWLSNASASTLANDRHELDCLRKSLEENNLYVFTVNAFPFGAFHGRRIKADVYLPDWTSQMRLEHSLAAANALAAIIPDGAEASASSVPGCHAANASPDAIRQIARNLRLAAEGLARIFDKTSRKITLAIEPEPDCLWETPWAFAKFHAESLAKGGGAADEFIGLCLDCCHVDVVGAPKDGVRQLLLDAAAPKTAKIQLSAAIEAIGAESKTALASFAEDVYLHQTRVFHPDGSSDKFPDLPDALAAADKSLPWRTHFHVPINADTLDGGLAAAKQTLEDVLRLARASPDKTWRIEIETYSFNALPPSARPKHIWESVAAEYAFAFKNLQPKATT